MFTVFLAISLTLFTACSGLDYCVHCIGGHIDVMSRSRPIADVLADPQVPEVERKQLAKVLDIRAFSIDELSLPDNNSYRRYADVGRQYVVWNIIATPEFSLTPKQWCYPVVGCMAYKGYFDPDLAKVTAVELASQGYDVDVYGVKAYSTLKWFDDPVLNTFLNGADSQLAGLIFHELAHQVVYVNDDCQFNEAFAKSVEIEGLRRWLRANSDDLAWHEFLDRELRSKDFLSILGKASEQLVTLYDQHLGEEEKRLAKREIFTTLESKLRSQQNQWPNPAAIDKWLERGLNNARLASIATYNDQVPAFQAILASQRGDMQAFYDKVKSLAKLSVTERTAQLKQFGFVEMNPNCTDSLDKAKN